MSTKRRICTWVAALGAVGAGGVQVSPAEAGNAGRILRKEIVVAASPEEVWHAWTTGAGIAGFFTAESKIELRLGGPYELYMGMTEPDESGKRGSEGCKILSYVPHEMLSFEWNFSPATPTLRSAGAKTHVVLRFERLAGGRTRVRFAQLGWKEGEDWDKGYAYFDRAWTAVLNNLKEHFDKKRAKSDPARDSANAAEREPKSESSRKKTWTDGNVTVTADCGSSRAQKYELTIPAPVKEVWSAIATTQGFRKHLAPRAEIELKPGGRYETWPGAPNKVLSYVPFEMLSTSGSAPPQFPNVRQGGTWNAYFLEPIDGNRTRLRLVVVGWQAGDEWDRAYDYFLKNHPIFLNHLHKQLSGSRADASATQP